MVKIKNYVISIQSLGQFFLSLAHSDSQIHTYIAHILQTYMHGAICITYVIYLQEFTIAASQNGLTIYNLKHNAQLHPFSLFSILNHQCMESLMSKIRSERLHWTKKSERYI